MTDKRLINPVADTMDKQRTYREQMGRFKQAGEKAGGSYV